MFEVIVEKGHRYISIPARTILNTLKGKKHSMGRRKNDYIW